MATKTETKTGPINRAEIAIPGHTDSAGFFIRQKHINQLIVEQIHPGRKFLIRLEDFPQWVGEYGDLRDPETGKPCRLLQVVWDSGFGQLAGQSWAGYRWNTNVKNRATRISLYTGASETPVAHWERQFGE